VTASIDAAPPTEDGRLAPARSRTRELQSCGWRPGSEPSSLSRVRPDRPRGVPVSDDADLGTVAGLLADADTRTLLEAVAEEPASPTELAELVDVSRKTVYRRLDQLHEAGLVSEHTRPRADGHHETVYTAALEGIHVELTDDGLTYRVETDEDPADELTKLWGAFGR
jgi:DNA-binding HxlR family transcriptional regulator